MAQHEEIIVWLDRRWKEAIEHHLKDETLQEHLENVLDELCNQLPEREYARISREIWEEDRMAREKAEAARTYSAYRVVEGGEEHYFRMTPGEELLDAARTLRKYLKDTGHSTGKFISLYLQAQPTERFPAILSTERLQEAAQRRLERKPAAQITEAQKALRRLCNGRPSAAVESQVLSLLNCLAAAPEQIKPQPQAVNRGEQTEMERRFSAALTTSPVDEDGAKEIALRLAGMQYSAIGSSEYESQRLRHLFTSAAPMAEIDAELLKSTVSQVYVKKGQASLLLKNGQIIERRA